ncbi:MAG: XTP/dITP diphosphatase [Candidatus Bathyarchaeia archaeon]
MSTVLVTYRNSVRSRLLFVTSNMNKVHEAKSILGKFGIVFKHLNLKYPEIQAESLRVIASESAQYLYEKMNNPLFIEDSGLFIDALGGFPGPYSSYVYETIGNNGILKLMEGTMRRSARFESVVVYIDSPKNIHIFTGIVRGTISSRIRGQKWGFDPIFIPEGKNQTYAEMGFDEKQMVSHRRIALEKFAFWILKSYRKVFRFSR